MHKNKQRRTFIKQTIGAGIALGAQSILPRQLLANEIQPASFAQTPLPYAFGALEPHIDAMTMEI
ncbi:MAG: Iron/manganese superoxide dismutase, alpha-hairpin domain, partial [Bacteroidota bacterium]